MLETWKPGEENYELAERLHTEPLGRLQIHSGVIQMLYSYVQHVFSFVSGCTL